MTLVNTVNSNCYLYTKQCIYPSKYESVQVNYEMENVSYNKYITISKYKGYCN